MPPPHADAPVGGQKPVQFGRDASGRSCLLSFRTPDSCFCYSAPCSPACDPAATLLLRTSSVLRHQLQVALRNNPSPPLRDPDRILWVWLRRRWPSGWREHLVVVQPTTVLHWHPKGWRLNWSWKSRTTVGRPRLGTEVRELIRSPKTTRSWAPSASEASCSSLTSPSFDSPIQVAQAEAQGEPDLANLLIESSEGHLGRRPVRGADLDSTSSSSSATSVASASASMS